MPVEFKTGNLFDRPFAIRVNPGVDYERKILMIHDAFDRLPAKITVFDNNFTAGDKPEGQ